MKTHPYMVPIVMGLFLGASLLAQGFNLRQGTWEFNMVMEGAMSMEGIPPAMRAQIEAEMRKPKVYQSCVTAEDVKNLELGKADDDDDEDCKVVTSKMTATTGDIVRQCTGDRPRTETSHFEATTPQTLRASISSKAASGTSTIALTGKWVSAQCKE